MTKEEAQLRDLLTWIHHGDWQYTEKHGLSRSIKRAMDTITKERALNEVLGAAIYTIGTMTTTDEFLAAIRALRRFAEQDDRIRKSRPPAPGSDRAHWGIPE